MEYEVRINNALGKILRNFNFLELNIGLCLRFLQNPKKPEEAHAFLKKAGLPEEIQRLKSLIVQNNIHDDISEFEKWIMQADEVRQLRNYFAHAIWEYLPLVKDAPLQLNIPPWRAEGIDGKMRGKMTIEEIEGHAEKVETVFKQFMRIRKKYGI